MGGQGLTSVGLIYAFATGGMHGGRGAATVTHVTVARITLQSPAGSGCTQGEAEGGGRAQRTWEAAIGRAAVPHRRRHVPVRRAHLRRRARPPHTPLTPRRRAATRRGHGAPRTPMEAGAGRERGAVRGVGPRVAKTSRRRARTPLGSPAMARRAVATPPAAQRARLRAPRVSATHAPGGTARAPAARLGRLRSPAARQPVCARAVRRRGRAGACSRAHEGGRGRGARVRRAHRGHGAVPQASVCRQ
jgi:hypothetical protein